uniref:Ankyrin repeat domain-containing protein 24-like n=1 Tax=Saccoglossus kowalevskii TaxID=10224 RepID=A0ABM0GID4_SACKO|nr:PREDICTED: ankyrin repeat domain-containing protein 24-like [Saccoglossus kowalevskii]
MSTVLHKAILNERLHQTRLLVSLGANIEKRDRDGRTPLMLCTVINNQEYAFKMFMILLRAGAYTNVRDNHGRSVLNYACLYGRVRMLKRLLKEEILELNFTDENGDTPLNHAAISGQLEIVKILVEELTRFGMPVDMRNKQGYTALLLATKHGNYECARVLLNEGNASLSSRDNECFMNAGEWAKYSHEQLTEKMRNRDGMRLYPRSRSAWECTVTPLMHSSPQSSPRTARDFDSASLPPISLCSSPKPSGGLTELRRQQTSLSMLMGSLEERQRNGLISRGVSRRNFRPPSSTTNSSIPTHVLMGSRYMTKGEKGHTMADDLRKLFNLYQQELCYRSVSTPPDVNRTPILFQVPSVVENSRPPVQVPALQEM